MRLIQADIQTRGPLFAIGGAEDKKGRRRILRHFCQLCGGDDARIAVIPTASALAETGRTYAQLFAEICGAETLLIDPQDRAAAMSQASAAALDSATGIFLTGGSQLKLVTRLGGTPLAQALLRAHLRGAPIAGTSAGASALSSHMIESGRSGQVPRYGMVRFAPGLGLTNHVIIDQHFSARRRLGRLITAVATNPALIGLGVDEDTAALIEADHVASVVGRGTVTIVDGSEISQVNLHQLRSGQPASIVGVKLHVLSDGWRYNLQTREVIADEDCGDVDLPGSELLELSSLHQHDG